VDLLPGTLYSQQTANCCKGGVLSAWMQDPAIASFQLTVGAAGTSNSWRTVAVPTDFTLKTPGLSYSCGPATVIMSDKSRVPKAFSNEDLIFLFFFFFFFFFFTKDNMLI
jgi:hypothetical protein